MYMMAQFANKFRNLCWCSTLIKQKNSVVRYSQYPKYYVEPVYQPKVLEDLYTTGEAQKLIHLPIKAALSSQNASINHDPLVSLFTNYLMRDGLKVLARELMDRTFEKIKRVQLEKYHKATTPEEKDNIELNPRLVFHSAIENCKPLLELTPIKRGGVTYQVPVPITDKRSQFISMKWIITAGKDKEKTVHLPDKLAYELIDASNYTGRVIKRKQDLHKQCEANRAYAHYRWS